MEENQKAKYMELQMLNQQTKQVQEQIQQLDMQTLELKKIIVNLDELKKTEKGTEIFTPVSAGIFAKAKLEETNELLVNVGANIAVKKNIEDSKKLLTNQMDEIITIKSQLGEQLKTLDVHLQKIQEELITSKMNKSNEKK